MKGFKHNVRWSLKAVAAVALLLSVGSASPVASAHHVTNHVRTSRRARSVRHGRRGTIKLRRRKSAKKAKKLTQRQINRNCNELYQRTITDINRDRRRYHLPNLRVDKQLSKIGSYRSHQLQSYFSHNVPQHENEAQYLLDHHHVKYQYYGENIASSPLGKIEDIAVGPYDNPGDASQNTLVYRAKNGYQLANNIENASMNHDQADQNGHRTNILDHKFKRIGVGTSYSSHDNNYYLAIEFIG